MSPEALFHENQKLVPYTVNRYFKKHAFNEDVLSAGHLGLWKACLNYNPEKGTFSTIAVRYIHGYIQHELLDHNNPFNTVDEEMLYLQPYQEVCYRQIEDNMYIEHFLSVLEPAEAHLCRILLTGKPKAEAGRMLGVSHTTVDNRLKKIQTKYNRYTKRNRNAEAYIKYLHKKGSAKCVD